MLEDGTKVPICAAISNSIPTRKIPSASAGVMSAMVENWWQFGKEVWRNGPVFRQACQSVVKLTREAMSVVETQLERVPHLDKWFVDIVYPSPAIRDS